MNDSIFIPKKIKVGFQKRNDTYTGKLAYVIYYDEKGKLHKEASWSYWRDQKIDPEDFDNVPTEGFVLNKKVGGTRYTWNTRQTYARVYDPRGFEFEITIPNLLYILEHTNSIKGKGLEGEFVYGWSGTELVLLPTSSPDYQQLENLNNMRFEHKKIGVKDLKPGIEYIGKNNKRYVYMGQFDAYGHVYKFDGKQFLTQGLLERYARDNEKPLYPNASTWEYRYTVYGGRQEDALFTYEPGLLGKRHFFYCKEEYEDFKLLKSISGQLIGTTSDEPVPNFVEIFDKLEANTMYSPLDPSKTEALPEDPQEVIQRVNSNFWHGTKYLTVISGNLEEVEIRRCADSKNDAPTMYRCSFTSRSSKLNMQNFFPHAMQGMFYLMVPVNVEEILEKFPPVYINEYLENGKFYRKRYSYDY